ncbi:hypothetical protein M758_UG028200 [Ceratodon purpureus]|nr:hypothetical protein M758_UG028200 [Ceratodon purpureus]
MVVLRDSCNAFPKTSSKISPLIVMNRAATIQRRDRSGGYPNPINELSRSYQA